MVECNSLEWKLLLSVPLKQENEAVTGAGTDSTSRCAQTEKVEEGSDTEHTDTISPARCAEIVESVQRGERVGLEELYGVFGRGIRYYLCRHLGPKDLEDRMHDTFLIVVQAIRRDELREPGRLLGFIRTIVRRQVAAHIEQEVSDRRDSQEMESRVNQIEDFRMSPEEQVLREDRSRLMRTLLDELDERDRDVIRRFYLLEQSQEQICQEMGLTSTQYRLIKSRAKARLEELGKRVLEPTPVAKERLKRMAAAV
jgi:RNA polymerase sigma-70 factor, ECF subfamily